LISFPLYLRLKGNVLFHLRAYEDSRHFYLRALNAKKKLSPNKNCVDVANAIFNMGNCCMKLGEFDEAFAFLNKAREIYASINEESLEMAQVCSQIGCLHSLVRFVLELRHFRS